MRSVLKTGNLFLLVTDEVTYTFYICSAFWPLLWIRRSKEKYTAGRSCAKFLPFHVPLSHRIGAQFQHCFYSPERVMGDDDVKKFYMDIRLQIRV